MYATPTTCFTVTHWYMHDTLTLHMGDSASHFAWHEPVRWDQTQKHAHDSCDFNHSRPSSSTLRYPYCSSSPFQIRMAFWHYQIQIFLARTCSCLPLKYSGRTKRSKAISFTFAFGSFHRVVSSTGMKFKLTCGVLRMVDYSRWCWFRFVYFISLLLQAHIAIYIWKSLSILSTVSLKSTRYYFNWTNLLRKTRIHSVKRILMDKKWLNEHAITRALPSTAKVIFGSNRICHITVRVMHP